MIVIGIDPGVARLGYGVIKVERGVITPICYGCIETKAGRRQAERLLEIYTEIIAIFARYPPDFLAMEKLFFSKNVTLSLIHI